MIKVQEVKHLFAEKLATAAAVCGVIPEMEGELSSRNPGKVRLRCSFREFEIIPVSDSENILSGEVFAEILYEPGESESAEDLSTRLSQVFAPGEVAFQNQSFRIQVSSVSFLEQKIEGKYQRTGISFQITVRGVHDS